MNSTDIPEEIGGLAETLNVETVVEEPAETPVPVTVEIEAEIELDPDTLGSEASDLLVEESDGVPEESDFPELRLTNPNVSIPEGGTYSTALKANVRVNPNDRVVMPSLPPVEMNTRGEQIPESVLTALAATDEGSAWLERLMTSQSFLMRGNALDASQRREDSSWEQRPSIDGERFGIARPRTKDDSDGGLLTGDKAAIRLRQMTSSGALLRFPLWHSGLWITLKAPSDGDLLQLDRRIAANKIQLGNTSFGMIFSNVQVTTVEFLVEFILKNLNTVNVPIKENEDLLDLIMIEDLPTLIWGALCTIYPAGYPYARPCVASPGKCNHVVEELLELSKLSFTDVRRLTPLQRKHMAMRTDKRSLEDLKRYRGDHVVKSTTVEIAEGVTAVLRSPTLREYIHQGNAWIDSLRDAVDSAFGGTMSDRERNEAILQYAKISGANQYSHYVERVVMRNDRSDQDNFVEGQEDVAKLMGDVISGEPAMFEKLMEGVGKYIDEASISMIAIPRFSCPVCNHDQAILLKRDGTPQDMKVHPYLIPLDMVSLFFTITARRISRALQKAIAGV